MRERPPEVKYLAKNIGNTVAALAKDIGQFRGALVGGFLTETPVGDVVDTFLNAWGTLTAAVSPCRQGLPETRNRQLEGRRDQPGSRRREDPLRHQPDIKQLNADADAHVKAELQAYRQYSLLLTKLETNVTAMKTAVADCRKKQQPPTTTPSQQPPKPGVLGPPPPAPGQSRCAALAGPSQIRYGSEVTYRAGPGHPDACGGGPVTWRWGPGWQGLMVVKGCGPDAPVCVFKAIHATGHYGSSGWVPGYGLGCLAGGSGEGDWSSCLYYAEAAPLTGFAIRVCTPGPNCASDLTNAPKALPDGTAGKPYSAQLVGTAGKTPYVYGARLPKGLVIDPLSGLIYGTPTSRGTTVVAVRVEDSSNPPRVLTKKLPLRIR